VAETSGSRHIKPLFPLIYWTKRTLLELALFFMSLLSFFYIS
jgi:hypothetical protein